MSHRTRVYSLILAFTSVLLISLASSQLHDCENHQDCFNNPIYGQFSKCVDRYCHCLDFFVLSPLDNGCINAVPAGQSCIYTDQCIGAMGNHGHCNRTTRVCECERLTDVEMVIFKGRCTQVRKHGESCINDEQCIVGSNEFGRCNNGTEPEARVCGCLENDFVKFVLDESSNKCEQCECKNRTIKSAQSI